MKKVFHLSTCDTCRKILKDIDAPADFELQDIGQEPLNEEQLEKLVELSGSYEALFSKRARLYKEKGLKDKKLSEEDYKNLLLEHYTFLKRPVIVNDKTIFIGNSRKTIEAAKQNLHE